MTFENLDSNFEKRVQEANDKNASPEEQHFNKTQQVNQEKPKYESVMGSQLGSGLLSVFQNQLQSVRKPTDNSDSFAHSASCAIAIAGNKRSIKKIFIVNSLSES